MKISLGEIDQFLNDPEEWAYRQKNAGGIRRVGYTHVTRMGIYRFHQSKSLASAQAALTGYLDSYKLTNLERRAFAEETLTRYASWAESSSDFVIAHSLRMRLDLHAGLYISGQIHRVDLLAESAIHQPVMLYTAADSKSRALAAVIQAGYSKAAGRDPDWVVPAHQNLDGSGLAPIALTERQRSDVLRRLASASEAAARILAK